jgi:hypothetical protein
MGRPTGYLGNLVDGLSETALAGFRLDFRADVSFGVDHCRGDFGPANVDTDRVFQSDILAP